jgi:hypothetical protein
MGVYAGSERLTQDAVGAKPVAYQLSRGAQLNLKRPAQLADVPS